MPNWLEGLRTKLMGGPPGVYLGGFGKHVGWNDHIDPIGLDSEPLLAAHDILYVRGIGGVIDAAMWEKKPEETLAKIAHVFCWNAESDTLIGRMWASTDGKGRARYPMMAVAHLGVPFSYTLAGRTAAVLTNVEARCRQVTTAEEVLGVFAAGLAELRASLAQPPDALGGEPNRAACSRLAEGMGLAEGQTFARVLYAIEGKTRAFTRVPKSLPDKINLKMVATDVPAQQSRLPMAADDSIDGIAFWQKIITDFSPPKVPMLFLHPVDAPWVDLILGPPTPKTLFCIRANEAALPLASAVPYELDGAFLQTAGAFIDQECDLMPEALHPASASVETPPPLPPEKLS